MRAIYVNISRYIELGMIVLLKAVYENCLIRVLLVMLALVMNSNLKGQHYELEIDVNYGSFNQSDIKEFQETLLVNIEDELGIKAKEVDKFPNYYSYELIGRRQINLIGLGFSLNYASTGGKISYADYSGELAYTSNINRIRTSFEFNYLIGNFKSLQFHIGSSFGTTFTNYSLSSTVGLLESEPTSEELKFNSVNLSVEPYVYGKLYIIQEVLFLKFGLGYEVNPIKGKLKFKENKEFHLINNDEAVYADWSGYRLRLGIGIQFN